MNDLISRQAAIDALWKALYEYEDKTEKQFKESEDLNVGDWIEHRIFVQNMNDIDRQTILNLPPAQQDLNEWCYDCKEYDSEKHCCPRWNRVIRNTLKDAHPERKGEWIRRKDKPLQNWYQCSICGAICGDTPRYCSECGAHMERANHDRQD